MYLWYQGCQFQEWYILLHKKQSIVIEMLSPGGPGFTYKGGGSALFVDQKLFLSIIKIKHIDLEFHHETYQWL